MCLGQLRISNPKLDLLGHQNLVVLSLSMKVTRSGERWIIDADWLLEPIEASSWAEAYDAALRLRFA